MENNSTPIKKNKGKAVLVIIMALSILFVILFWAAIQLFQLNGLPLYFTQLGLYLILFLLAWWGLKQEEISLSFNIRMILEALSYTLIGWLIFVLFIQLIGLSQLPEEFQALKNIPSWKIGAQILSTWIFVGMGEEVLFRGYYLRAFIRHFTISIDRSRTVIGILLVCVFFSLWHLPNRIIWLITGEIDLILFFLSLLVLFLLGLGYAYLFIRSNNILLVGLVHGISDYSLVGKDSQMAPIILVVAIVCIEITRLITRMKGKAL